MRYGQMTVILAACLGTGGVANADAVYDLEVNLGWYGPQAGDTFSWQNTPGPIWTGGLYGCNRDAEGDCKDCSGQPGVTRIWGNAFDAHAAAGALGFHVDTHAACFISHGNDGNATVHSEFRLDDVVFTSAQDEGSITVTMNLELLADIASEGGVQHNSGNLSITCPGDPQFGYNAGPLGSNIPGYAQGQTVEFTTGSFNVPLNTPWTLIIHMGSSTTTSDEGGLYFEQSYAYLSFPTDLLTLVFNVPEGVTVSSVQGNIAGNIWTPPVQSCPGDVDHDGTVGINDFLAVLAAWGPCVDCPEDINGDDEVGIEDFLALLASWGGCP